MKLLATHSALTEIVQQAPLQWCLGTASVLAGLLLCEGIARVFRDFFVVRSWKREIPRIALLGLLFLVPIALPISCLVSAFVLWHLHRPDMDYHEALLLAVLIALSWMLLYLAAEQVWAW